MSLTLVFLDHRPACLAGTSASLLLAPLGATALLGVLRRHFENRHPAATWVVPGFAPDAHYAAALDAHAPGVQLADPAGFAAVLEPLELSDELLLVDPRFALLDAAHYRELLAESGESNPATRHLLCFERGRNTAQECVQLGPDLQVRAIQRRYEGVTRLGLRGVAATRLSVAAAHCVAPDDLAGLDAVRTRVSAAGFPSVDVPAAAPQFDLTLAGDFVAFAERAVARAVAAPLEPGYRAPAAGIWYGPDCDVHPGSRVYGPAILQAGVRVRPGAVLIGPVLVGAGAVIESGAVVSRSVVWDGTVVPPHAVVSGQVLPPGAARPLAASAASDGSDDLASGSHGAAPEAFAAPGTAYARLKRGIDFLLVLAGLIALAPLLLAVALLVRLTSPGPAFFAHQREGRNGRPFRCWKFRTMVDGAHAQQRALYRRNAVDGPQFKLPDDPRITWLGRRLRSTNIDELPQLFNVLVGHMSLIGPRPSPFRENQICVPWRQARLSVRPGITGLWQVCRRDRSAGDFHQWIYFDTLYVRHLSLGLDLRILLATVPSVLGWSLPLHWVVPSADAEAASGVPAPASSAPSRPAVRHVAGRVRSSPGWSADRASVRKGTSI